jgi:hypothetical protein
MEYKTLKHTSIGQSNFYSASPPRPCRILCSINPPHETTTPAGITGTTNTRSYGHRQQGNTTFLHFHYHIQLEHCTTLT